MAPPEYPILDNDQLSVTSKSATVHPTDDAIPTAPNSHFRSDLPYSQIPTSHRRRQPLANINNISAKEYDMKKPPRQLPTVPLHCRPTHTSSLPRSTSPEEEKNESQLAIPRYVLYRDMF
jgi:hypothetical protein